MVARIARRDKSVRSPPRPRSDPSISLNQSNPALGSSVTFTTVYPNSTKNPRIDVQCYQNGVLVYAEAGSVDHVFVLGGYASVVPAKVPASALVPVPHAALDVDPSDRATV